MYFVVMPRVNLIVTFLTYHVYLYSINFPTVICLPSMLFYLWRDTTSELWIPILFFHHIAITCLLSRTVYFTHILLLFSTRYTHNLCFKQTGEIDNLIVSWEQSIFCVYAGSTLQLASKAWTRCHI
jgi:hypothetical protein